MTISFRKVIYTLYMKYIEIGDTKKAAMSVREITDKILLTSTMRGDTPEKVETHVRVVLNMMRKRWGKVTRLNDKDGHQTGYWALSRDGVGYCERYLEVCYDYETDVLIESMKPTFK